MSRLPRPHIPLAIRVQVAERLGSVKYRSWGIVVRDAPKSPLAKRLQWLLELLFYYGKAELHHRPALVNRERKPDGSYIPDANDPEYLVYLASDDHDIETRVRGQHGQHSDLGLARKRKRMAKRRDPKRRVAKIPQRKDLWPKGTRSGSRRRG